MSSPRFARLRWLSVVWCQLLVVGECGLLILGREQANKECKEGKERSLLRWNHALGADLQEFDVTDEGIGSSGL